MISFKFLSKNLADDFLPILFKILYSNMSVIAPAGNSYDRDFRLWYDGVRPALKKDSRQIILIYDDSKIIGYFQYYVDETTFMMEEIQFDKKYRGTGLFRQLYSYLFEIIPQKTLYVEAYAHKKNKKSQSILKRLGLHIIGENNAGSSYLFRGNCRQVLSKYNSRDSAIKEMTGQIVKILSDLAPSVYLYGSIPLGDFRFGWSDIDILVLTDGQIKEEQAAKLVNLRQIMLEKDPDSPDSPYYRSFEGGMLTLDAFMYGKADRVVYWGSGGERITDKYALDSFGIKELIESSVLLYGQDVRSRLKAPNFSDLYVDVKRHYETIRKYARKTERTLHSFGWILDIARCVYTLRAGKIIAKTDAADWALNNDICPVPEALEIAAKVRRTPLIYKFEKELLDYAETLAEPIQRFADVLEKELKDRASYDCTGENKYGIQKSI